MHPISIDNAWLQDALRAIADCSSAVAPAITRIVYSDADQRARVLLRRWCAELDLTVHEDGLGNLFARWEGSLPQLTPVASGSHIDAIPASGMYDGTVGVIGMLGALRALQQAGFQPQRSLELILFTSEEPTRFGLGCLGSRALCGQLSPAGLSALRDSAGIPLDDARQAAGFTAPLAQVQRAVGCYHAFVELHIEQGPQLDQRGIPIGVVEAIAAPAALRVTLNGQGGHAGAVLMPDRRDALTAAAEVVLAVEQAARSSGSPDSVATTGRLLVEPNAVNAVPSRVMLEIDVRDINSLPRDGMLQEITLAVHAVAARRGLQVEIVQLNADQPVTCDPALRRVIADAANSMQLATLAMPSRAYHDSLFMAQLCPTAMIFIPCRGGVSHRPDEYAAPEAIIAGVQVLAETLRRLSA